PNQKTAGPNEGILKKAIDSLDFEVNIYDTKQNLIYSNKKIPRAASAEHQALEETLRTGKSARTENAYAEGCGEKVLDKTTYPYKENGKVAAVIEFIKDSTEEKNAEKRKEFLELLSKSVSEEVVMIDKDYNVNFCNGAGLVQREGPCKGKCYKLLHGISEPCWKRGQDCPLVRVMESGKECLVEHVHSEKGKNNIESIKAYPMKDAKGNLLGIVEVLRNISRQRELEKKQAAIIGNASEGIAIMEGNALTFANNRFLDMTETTPEEAAQLCARLIKDVKNGDVVNETVQIDTSRGKIGIEVRIVPVPLLNKKADLVYLIEKSKE
ncbi:MAG: PAS domain-containing protein, partial [Nanoarchaeota archaeon]